MFIVDIFDNDMNIVCTLRVSNPRYSYVKKIYESRYPGRDYFDTYIDVYQLVE